MDNYEDLLKLKQKKDVERQEKYMESSKHRLKEIAHKKMKTTMIGAIHAIETEFHSQLGYDEEGNDLGDKLTDEQIEFRKLFQRCRDKILDIGNNQSRGLSTEIDMYNVEWKRYQIVLPVKQRKDK